ncbi:MAG: DNA starvation/stationary phase protection protein [Chloroflexota bacterium]
MPTTTTRKSASAQHNGQRSAQPRYAQLGKEIQAYGSIEQLPIALAADARRESCQLLNQVLADTTILYSLYKKHHWLVAGPTFYQLHLLFDKHAEEQLALVDLLAERVQTLGGIAISDPRHVAEVTKIERPPNGREDVPAMISRLLEAHELVLEATRDAITRTEKNEDWGSNDLLMSDVLRRNELQVWFVAEHLVDVPLVEE